MKKIALLIIAIVSLFPSIIYAADFDGWRVMPIRSEEEYNKGKIGGEGMQHPHGIARCLYHPEVIYMSHDVGHVWKSIDSGESWIKCICKNMPLWAGQSVEVDPVNPDIVFEVLDDTRDGSLKKYEGLYRSVDGGVNWKLVLPTSTNYFKNRNRMYKHNIAYDLTSINSDNSKAMRWYAAFHENGLYRSEDSGDSWEKVTSLSDHTAIFGIHTHPYDGKTVYLSSDKGLFISRDRGKNFRPLGDLPKGHVSGIQINPDNPDIIYAVIKGSGLFKSIHGGRTFSKVIDKDAISVFINPGFPEVVYLISFLSNIMVSYDGGLTWLDDIKISTTGLNKQYRTPIDYEQKVVGNTAWAPEEIQVLNNISSDQTGVVPNPKDRNEAVLFSRACFYKTTDGGKNFRDSSTLFTGFWWGTFDEGILFDKLNPDRFVTFNADLGMAITENGGEFFTVRNLDRQVYYDGIISWFGQYAGDFQPVKDSKTIVASVGYYSDTKLVYTTDAGLNWHLCNNGAIPNGNYSYIKFHPNDPNVVYAGDKISYDSGRTFEVIPFLTQHHARLFGMSPSNPDIIYAFGWEKLLRVVNKVYRSDDRGKNWKLYTQIDGNLAGFGSRGFAFEVHPKNPDIIYTLDGNGDIAVYDGQLWKSLGVLKSANIEKFKPYVGGIAIDPNFPNIIYIKLRGSGIDHMWRSIDGGKTWRNISYNLPRMGGSGININPHTGELFNAALFGTWIFPPPYKSNNMVYDRKITRPFPGPKPAVYYGKIMDENNNSPEDNMIVRIYDETDGQLIGECITRGGYYYIVADSDDKQTKEKEGATEAGKKVIKINKDGKEYILFTNSNRTESFISHKSGDNAEIQLFTKDVSLAKE